MAILGEYGEVERIDCVAEESEVAIVKGGEIVSGVPTIRLLEVITPENCLRREGFDEARIIGCISCGHSVIEYTDGLIEC